MASPTRIEQKQRPHKRFKTEVTWGTLAGEITAHRGGLPRVSKKCYGVLRHGFGPEVKVTTVA